MLIYHTKGTHEVVKGKEYDYISPLPITKLLNGLTAEVRWYKNNVEIHGTDIVSNECTHTLQGKAFAVFAITLNSMGVSNRGTTTIYEVYNVGYFLDRDGNEKMTTTGNGINLPSENGYTFLGYYTGENGSGVKYIDSNGKLTSDASSTNYRTSGTLYAKWKLPNPIAITSSQSWSEAFSTSAKTKVITAATNAQGAVTYAINSQPSGNYFSISGTTLTKKANTPVGTYSVVIRATAAGNANYNSGFKDITMTVTVTKATNPIAVTASQSWSEAFATSAKTKAITAATNAQGAVTYAINSQPSGNYFTISGTTLTKKASTPVGTYSVVIRATAAGNSNYNSGSKDITMTVTVTRASINFPTCTSKPYDGTKQTLWAASNGANGYTNNALTGVFVGTYSVTLTPTSNYQWSSGSNVTSGRSLSCSITGVNRWECYYEKSAGNIVSCDGNPKNTSLTSQRWVYYNTSGTRVQSGWVQTGDSSLNPDSNSKKDWYYFSGGYAYLGWYQDPSDNCWYYLSTFDSPPNPNGSVDAAALTNISDIEINGNKYSFSASGRCYKGNGCLASCNH